MAIFRGVGGSGDSSDNSFLQEVTGQANAASASASAASASASAASASASAASASATSALNTELTSASFNTSDGVLTLTKQDGQTVTTDLDGRFLTSYTETNNLSSAVTWANVPDANITQSSVTQHQAALSITESQISNLQSYLTTHQDITGKANLSGATFTGDVSFNDDVKAKFGTDSDLLIYHNNGEPSIIEDAGELGLLLKTNGNIFGVVTDTNESMILAQPDGTVSLFFNNEQKLATSTSGISVTGTINGVDLSTVITTTNASFDDDVKLKFGASDDLLIYHDTSSTDKSIIEDAGTNGLHLISDGNGIFLKGKNGHSIVSAQVPISGVTFAELYYNNSSRFRTTDDGVDVTGDIVVTGTVDGRDVLADGTKLDLIEANATADQTGAEIKTAYEAEADTNAFTDAEKTKLSGIEASADVTDATNVTSAGAAMLASSPTFTGTITAPNVDISTSGSVTTNIATGQLSAQGDTKTINIGTGFGAFGTTTVNIGSHASDPINLNGAVTVEGNLTVDGTIDATIDTLDVTGGESSISGTKSSLASAVLDVRNDTAATGNNSGTIITLTAKDGSTYYTKGAIGTSYSQYVGAQYSSPYFAHTATNYDSGIRLNTAGSTAYNGIVSCDADGQATNNKMSLGSPSYKWATVYATTGSINTSDQTHKRDVEELSEAETRVAVACKGLLRKYRWKDAYEEKGEEARIHFGIMAQDLRDAFSAEGLDASRYAMFCSDTWWEDETGERHEEQDLAPEGAVETTQLGVRYDELLAFIIAAI
jgi:cytoskeletal protein CcmA (bactofilin family)